MISESLLWMDSSVALLISCSARDGEGPILPRPNMRGSHDLPIFALFLS